MKIPSLKCVLTFACASPVILHGAPITASVSDTDGDAMITLTVTSPLTTGVIATNGQIEIDVLGSENAFTAGDTLTVSVFEDDAVNDDLVFTDTFTITTPELTAQRVTRTFPLVFDPGQFDEAGGPVLEFYAELLVVKDTTSGFHVHDNPVTSLLMVSVEVGLKIITIVAEPVAGGMEVSLAVETVGGWLLVDSVEVEHAADPAGPWDEIGTISGDGEAYAGMVTAPPGGVGFVRVKVP